MILLLFLLLSALLISSLHAHMMMDRPCPRSSPKCRSSGGIDYDLEAPLNYRPEPEIGGSYPCKGHTRQGPPTFTVRPGQSISTRFSGSDNHAGGHCQFALSYDNGRSWAVVRTILHDCLAGSGTGPYSYTIPVPETAASGRIVLGWLYYNKEGDQEVYMNCADGEIEQGRRDGYISGKELLVLRLRGYRQLGEWKYGGDDGVGMFNARRDIVIRANETSTTDPAEISRIVADNVVSNGTTNGTANGTANGTGNPSTATAHRPPRIFANVALLLTITGIVV